MTILCKYLCIQSCLNGCEKKSELHKLNVLLYYPQVTGVEELIFCNPLVLMKIVSKVVKHTYKGATKEWRDTRERGVITIKQLEDRKICTHSILHK